MKPVTFPARCYGLLIRQPIHFYATHEVAFGVQTPTK